MEPQSIKRSVKGMTKCIRYKEVSLCRFSFSCILLLLGLGIPFVIPQTSIYRDSLMLRRTDKEGQSVALGH